MSVAQHNDLRCAAFRFFVEFVFYTLLHSGECHWNDGGVIQAQRVRGTQCLALASELAENQQVVDFSKNGQSEAGYLVAFVDRYLMLSQHWPIAELSEFKGVKLVWLTNDPCFRLDGPEAWLGGR